MKKLILVYRYVQISPCCIYCLVEEGVLIDKYGFRYYPWNIYARKRTEALLCQGIKKPGKDFEAGKLIDVDSVNFSIKAF